MIRTWSSLSVGSTFGSKSSKSSKASSAKDISAMISCNNELRDILTFEDPDLLRATDLSEVTACAGRAFRRPDGESEADLFDKTQSVEQIHTFISHNWATARWHKYLAVTLHFNLNGGLMVALGFIAAGIAWHQASGAKSWHGFLHLVTTPAMVIAVFLGRRVLAYCGCRGPTIFLDVCCIHQTDKALQRKGIEIWTHLNLPASHVCHCSSLMASSAKNVVLKPRYTREGCQVTRSAKTVWDVSRGRTRKSVSGAQVQHGRNRLVSLKAAVGPIRALNSTKVVRDGGKRSTSRLQLQPRAQLLDLEPQHDRQNEDLLDDAGVVPPSSPLSVGSSVLEDPAVPGIVARLSLLRRGTGPGQVAVKRAENPPVSGSSNSGANKRKRVVLPEGLQAQKWAPVAVVAAAHAAAASIGHAGSTVSQRPRLKQKQEQQARDKGQGTVLRSSLGLVVKPRAKAKLARRRTDSREPARLAVAEGHTGQQLGDESGRASEAEKQTEVARPTTESKRGGGSRLVAEEARARKAALGLPGCDKARRGGRGGNLGTGQRKQKLEARGIAQAQAQARARAAEVDAGTAGGARGSGASAASGLGAGLQALPALLRRPRQGQRRGQDLALSVAPSSAFGQEQQEPRKPGHPQDRLRVDKAETEAEAEEAGGDEEAEDSDSQASEEAQWRERSSRRRPQEGAAARLKEGEQQELRAAVLAQLQRAICADVSDAAVLADFVCVLVDQRKTREEMTKELAFFHDEAEPFVAWVLDSTAKLLARRHALAAAAERSRRQRSSSTLAAAGLEAPLPPSSPADVARVTVSCRALPSHESSADVLSSSANERRMELLAEMTKRLQEILGRLADKSLVDAGREKYQAMAHTIQAQLTALSGLGRPGRA